MKYSLKLDMKPLTQALQKVDSNTRKDTLGKAVLAGLFELQAFAQLNIRDTFEQGTGDLASNWETKLDNSSDTSAEGHTAPLVVYARIHELGGVIHATNGPYLTFQTDDGSWHSVPAVTIPARPYLRPAIDEHQKEIVDAMSAVLTEAIERG